MREIDSRHSACCPLVHQDKYFLPESARGLRILMIQPNRSESVKDEVHSLNNADARQHHLILLVDEPKGLVNS